MCNQRIGMTTVLKHAVDLLASLQPSYQVYGANNSAFCDIVKKQSLKNTLTGDYMDRGLEHFNRESVRMTIMKQEETFKEQVMELHRLYKVQRKLMAELRNNAPQLHSPINSSSQVGRIGSRCIDTNSRTGFWTTPSTSESGQTAFDCWNNNSSTNQPNPGYNFHTLFSIRSDSNQQEQSSSCSRETPKIPKVIDLPQVVEEFSTDISATEEQAKMSVNSTSDPCFYNDGDSEVELTLSVGFGTGKKKSKHRKSHGNLELGCSSSNYHERRMSDPCLSVRSECSEATNTTGSVTAPCDRDGLQQPPWLFQSLSLHRT